MNTFFCVFIAAVAVMSCLPSTNSSKIMNTCKECTELLRETIELTIDDLRISALCMDNHIGPAVLVPVRKLAHHVTKEEIAVKVTIFTLELQMIRDAWENNIGGPYCLENLDIHLTRILCLVKSANHRKGTCIIREKFSRSSKSAVRHAKEYINDVYSTLSGFISNLQE